LEQNTNRRNLKNRIVLTTTFLIAIIGYSFWENLQHYLERYLTKEEAEIKASGFFFLCVELAFAGYTYLIKEILKDGQDKYIKMVSEFVFYTAFAAVIDRLFGDPYSVSYYDYFIFFLNIIITFRWKITESTNWKTKWIALREKLTALRGILIKYFST